MPARRSPRRAGNRGLDRVEEGVLQEQIVDRVGGEVELGEDGEVDIRPVRAPRFLENGIAIEANIRGTDPRGAGGHPDKAMSMQGHEVLAAPGLIHFGLAVSTI